MLKKVYKSKTEGKEAAPVSENYKGIYYNEDDGQKYYENGAHFPYRELCYRLERIVITLNPERRGKTIYDDFDFNNDIKKEDSTFTKIKYRSENSKVYL
jgi:hypothetical protein